MRWIYPLLPVHFDKNEWYTIGLSLLVLAVIKALPKKMDTSVFFFIYVFNIALTVFGDYFLAGNPLNFYDTLDRNSGELFDFVLHLFVYPIAMLILLTGYAYLYHANTKKVGTVLFILLSSFLLLSLEWVSARFFDLYTYLNWSFVYSFLVYIAAVSVNIATYKRLLKTYDGLIQTRLKNRR